MLVMVGLAAAAPVDAQTARRPYRGLFGPGERDERRPPATTLTLSVYTGHDDNAPFDTGGAADTALQGGRMFQGTLAAMTFRRARPRSTIGLDASLALRSYGDLNRATTQRHNGGIRIDLRPSPRVSVKASQSISYSPSYQLALGPLRIDDDGASAAATPEADVNYSVSSEKQATYGTSAGLHYTMGRTRGVAIDYSASYADFFTRPDFSTTSAGARYTQRLGSALELRLGYALGTMGLDGFAPVRNHNLDLGLNYGRSFTFARRTSLAFASGSTVVSADGVRHLQLTGSARLRRSLSPRWTAQVAYQRGLQMIDRLPRPFVTDAVTGSLSGYFHSRVHARLAPSYAWGADVADKAKTYGSWVNQLRVEAAISRHWAVYAEHFYYHYRFATAVERPTALAAGLDRRGLRWGLALWAPLSR